MHHVIIEQPPPSIQTAIVKSSICSSTFRAGYCFDILGNETASTDKSSKHYSPSLVPTLFVGETFNEWPWYEALHPLVGPLS